MKNADRWKPFSYGELEILETHLPITTLMFDQVHAELMRQDIASLGNTEVAYAREAPAHDVRPVAEALP